MLCDRLGILNISGLLCFIYFLVWLCILVYVHMIVCLSESTFVFTSLQVQSKAKSKTKY